MFGLPSTLCRLAGPLLPASQARFSIVICWLWMACISWWAHWNIRCAFTGGVTRSEGQRLGFLRIISEKTRDNDPTGYNIIMPAPIAAKSPSIDRLLHLTLSSRLPFYWFLSQKKRPRLQIRPLDLGSVQGLSHRPKSCASANEREQVARPTLHFMNHTTMQWAYFQGWKHNGK